MEEKTILISNPFSTFGIITKIGSLLISAIIFFVIYNEISGASPTENFDFFDEFGFLAIFAVILLLYGLISLTKHKKFYVKFTADTIEGRIKHSSEYSDHNDSTSLFSFIEIFDIFDPNYSEFTIKLDQLNNIKISVNKITFETDDDSGFTLSLRDLSYGKSYDIKKKSEEIKAKIESSKKHLTTHEPDAHTSTSCKKSKD